MNIVATIAHHATDPDKLREQAEEEAFSKVEDATLKQISKNAEQLAAQLAPTLAQDWMTQTRARYMSYVGTGKIPTLLDATAQDITPPQVIGLHRSNSASAPLINLSAFLPAWLNPKKYTSDPQPETPGAEEIKEDAKAQPVPLSGNGHK